MRTIFVSSTFKDMHYERDAIQEIVHPRINSEARKYGQSVSFCDLRWGIDTSELETETGSQKVLDVCLGEIDRCESPMVVILGYRYGWIPSESLVRDTASRYDLQLDDLEKSVTALEIEYGALENSEKLENTLFYFREIQGNVPDDYLTEDDDHARRIAELKERIIRLTGGRIRTYTLTWDDYSSSFHGIEEFAGMMCADLKEILIPSWQQYDQMSAFEKELYIHETYLKEKAKMFRAREHLAEQVTEQIRGGERLTILKGDSGCGKSTLLSHLVVTLREEGWEVLPLFSGLTAESTTAFDILKLMVYYLEEELGSTHFDGSKPEEEESGLKEKKAKTLEEAKQMLVPEEGKPAEMPEQKQSVELNVKIWRERLDNLCAQCTAAGYNVIFMLDAADQLYDDEFRDQLIFIPSYLSDKVRFVMTCLTEFSTSGSPFTEILPVDDNDKKQVIQGILAGHNRELSGEVVDAMMKLRAADNPLYLSFLVQSLLMMNKSDFDTIRSLGDGMEAITEHQLKLIHDCPESLGEMSAILMEKAGERINGSMVKRSLFYIALSDHGLRVSDLAALLGTDFNMLNFAHFISYMDDCFLVRDDGRYDFSHKSIREGLLERCVDQKKLHADMLLHFSRLDEQDDIRKREIIYHCIKADDKQFFVDYLKRYSENEDRSFLHYAAVNTYAVSLEDNGQWLCTLLKQAERYGAQGPLTQFIYFEYNHLSVGRFTELKTLLRIEELNVTLAEKRYLAEKTDISLWDLACSYEVCASCCLQIGGKENLKLALKYQGKHLDARKKIAENTQYSNRWRDLAIACRQTAGLKKEVFGDMDEVRDMLLQSLAIFEKLVEEQDSPERLNDLADQYLRLAEEYNGLFSFDRENAAAYYRKAIDIYENLAGRQEDSRYDLKLANAYGCFSKLYMKDNSTENQAVVLLEKQLEIIKKVNEEKKSVNMSRKLANCHYQLAKAASLADSDKREKPTLHYKRAVALYDAVAAETGSVRARRNLAAICEEAGGFFSRLSGKEMKDEAARLFQKSISVRKSLIQDIGDEKDIFALSRCYNQLGDLCREQAEAEEYYRMADELEAETSHAGHSHAYSEVLEVLRHMEAEYINKIPKEIIVFLYDNRSRTFDCRMTKGLAEEPLSETALIFLNVLKENYWKA